jgi:hypothetical protein
VGMHSSRHLSDRNSTTPTPIPGQQHGENTANSREP